MWSHADEQEAARPTGWIVDRLPRLRVHDGDNGIDQRTGREILARAALHFCRVAFKQPFVNRAFGIDAEPHPFFAVNERDQPAQLGRVFDFGLGLEEDRSDQALLP